eukprot:gene7215-11531_t
MKEKNGFVVLKIETKQMGNCLPTESPQTTEGNTKLVENQKGRKKFKTKLEGTCLKVLLLGTGESGKTTFFKQLKLQKSTGYSNSDIEDYTVAVRSNIIIALRALLEASQTLNFDIQVEENQKFAEEFLQDTENLEDIGNLAYRFNKELSQKIFYLWNDKGIQSVHAVIFVIALSEYDLLCYEDNETLRMDESLSIFESICNNSVFDEVPMIIFFNKNDLFIEKVKTVDLNVYDKNYTGGCDYDNAFEHIKGLFLKHNKNPDRNIDIYVCTSTDSEEFSEKFDKIKDGVIDFVSKKKKQ